MFAQITAAGQRIQTLRALRHRNFRWFWFSASAQSAGRGMQFLVLGWLILEYSDSATQLGLVIFLYGVPNLSFGVIGGIFADRLDRLSLLKCTQGSVTLLIFALAGLTLADLVQLWHVYAAAFLLGTVQALNMPTRMAMVADLVDREDIMNAVALNSAVMNSGRILGPLAAGGVIELAGIGPALALNGVCYFLGTGLLFFMNGSGGVAPVQRTSIIGDLFTGVRYVLAAPVALTLIVMGYSFGFFGMPHLQVMPAYAKEALGVGPAGAGLLITAAGVGSLLGSIILASLGNFRQKNWLLLGTIFLFSFSLILFALSPWFWVSWALLLLVGMGSMSYVSMVTTVLQMTVPSQLQGRVLSVWGMGGAMMFVGALPMGAAADLWGWTAALAAGPIITLVFVLWLGIWRSTIRRLQV